MPESERDLRPLKAPASAALQAVTDHAKKLLKDKSTANYEYYEYLLGVWDNHSLWFASYHSFKHFCELNHHDYSKVVQFRNTRSALTTFEENAGYPQNTVHRTLGVGAAAQVLSIEAPARKEAVEELLRRTHQAGGCITYQAATSTLKSFEGYKATTRKRVPITRYNSKVLECDHLNKLLAQEKRRFTREQALRAEEQALRVALEAKVQALEAKVQALEAKLQACRCQ